MRIGVKLRVALGGSVACAGAGAALMLGGATAGGAGLGTTTTTTSTPPPTTTTTTTTVDPPAVQQIVMRGDQAGPQGNLRFELEGGVAGQLVRGERLEIVNETDPMAVGPHSFTLLTGPAIKKGSAQRPRECFSKGICGEIAKWHDVDLQTGETGKPVVRVGGPGWNRKGNSRRQGDSWFTGEQGAEFGQDLTSNQRVLRFFCAVHPEMKGQIQITDPAPPTN